MVRVSMTVVLVLASCASLHAQKAAAPSPWQNAVVAADHPLASEAGIEMLRCGGNAIDAAVATSFALSVVRPASCGIGGGGFMLIWNADTQESICLDYRERAPMNASRDMFARTTDQQSSRTGGLAVAVPGTVAGLCYAASEFGTLPLEQLLAPAIRYAREGIAMDASNRRMSRSTAGSLQNLADHRERFRPLFTGYLNDGDDWPATARWQSPQLRALEQIAAQGAAGFYRGSVAESIVETVRRDGGIITPEDLASIAPVRREALTAQFDELTVLTMPPPSSGGIAIIQILNLISEWEALDRTNRLSDLSHNSPEYVHLIAEFMKHAFADRAALLGDADFVDVPVRRLISREYARRLLARVDATRTHPPNYYGNAAPVNDGGTSHISIIDSAGNAVACTETINTYFGSKLVDDRYGVVLNNEMDDFAAVPGQPNAFGLVQSENNAVAPRKKPLSSMSPTIVVEDGKAKYVAGASGGPKIISATLQVLLNQMEFGMKPDAAVSAPRFHHQWLPNQLRLEPKLHDSTKAPLQQLGHQIRRESGLAASQTVARHADGLYGASDSRKNGRAVGF